MLLHWLDRDRDLDAKVGAGSISENWVYFGVTFRSASPFKLV
jgi:hypothetical protein